MLYLAKVVLHEVGSVETRDKPVSHSCGVSFTKADLASFAAAVASKEVNLQTQEWQETDFDSVRLKSLRFSPNFILDGTLSLQQLRPPRFFLFFVFVWSVSVKSTANAMPFFLMATGAWVKGKQSEPLFPAM